MGDVGEETHVHGVQPFLLLLLHLRLTGRTASHHQAACVMIEIRCQQTSQYEIDEPCPPRPGGGRLHHHLHRTLVADRLVAGTVGGAQSEGVAP